jgi:hypothetical protein
MSRRRTAISLLACAALVGGILTGCGGGGSSNVDVGPAAAVPENASIYLDATVRPTGTAAADAKAAAAKIFGTNDPGGRIISLIQGASKAAGHPITYQQDIAPWLGKKAALFLTSLGTNSVGAAVVETTNPSAALATARKATGTTATSPQPQTYNGASYQAIPLAHDTVFGTVDNFLVEGDLAGFKAAVDAANGSSLGDSSDFKDAIGGLPADRLGTFYTIPKTLLDSLPSTSLSPNSRAAVETSAGDSLTEPVAGALSASADSVQLDATAGSNGVETPESSLIGSVPSDSWLVIGDGNLGATIKDSLEKAKARYPSIDTAIQQIQSTTGATIDQLTAALGNAVVYVEGTTKSTVTGALLVESKDPSLTGRLIGQLQGLAQFSGGSGLKPLSLSGGGTGFQVVLPNSTQPVEIAQQGNKLVIGYGAGSAQKTLSPASTIDSSPTFTKAKGQVSSLGTDFFLSFPDVFRLVESNGGAKKNPGFAQAKPYLDALDYLVEGSGTESDKTEVKAVLGLK